MAREFKLPDIGEGVHEGEVTKWFVKEGDAVQENDPLVEVMTDKVTVQIPSPVTGKIMERRAKEGETVQVGATLVVFGEAGGAVPHPPPPPAPPPPPRPPAPFTPPRGPPGRSPPASSRARNARSPGVARPNSSASSRLRVAWLPAPAAAPTSANTASVSLTVSAGASSPAWLCPVSSSEIAA